MEIEKPQKERRWLRALQPRGIIFGFSLGLFVLTLVHDHHQYALRSLGGRHPFFNPENEFATFLLAIAALGLLLRKWWGHLVAIVVGGRLVYAPGYLSLWIYANAEVGRLVEFATLKGWFHFTLETQPQYFLHAAVGAITCVYAAVALSRQIIRFNRTRANKALQLTAR